MSSDDLSAFTAFGRSSDRLPFRMDRSSETQQNGLSNTSATKWPLPFPILNNYTPTGLVSRVPVTTARICLSASVSNLAHRQAGT
jgi:hypothetical protein